MRSWIMLFALVALACTEVTPRPSEGPSAKDAGPSDPCVASDRDRDGYGDGCAEPDCDDTNAAIHPGAAEACNGIDEDCDGEVDEDLGEGFCGLGECRRASPYCVAGRPAACSPAPAVDEICNGLDDDCDGETDEELQGERCGVGACVSHAVCSGGAWASCVPKAPVAETCNRIDDDCNGVVDDALGTEVVTSSYTALTAEHSGCTQGGERIGPACNAAMHRLCSTTGCSTSGFGPLENTGDLAIVGCVRSSGRDVSYATLATHHGPCNGTQERIGPNCNAAIHRYCGSQGFVSGFGPAEQGADTALVQWVDGTVARAISTTYTVLASHHPNCTQAERIGPNCNAAIHRFCRAQGDSTGFGPVENIGDDAAVVCVR